MTHVAQHGCDAEAREAARFILRYFGTSGVQHHHDEDGDLFAPLRGKAAEPGRWTAAAAAAREAR